MNTFITILLLLTTALPIFGAERPFRPISPQARVSPTKITPENVVIHKSPDILAMLHDLRESPTDYDDPSKTAPRFVRQLSFQAATNVLAHLQKNDEDPAQVFVYHDKRTCGGRLPLFSRVLKSGKTLTRRGPIPSIFVNHKRLLKNGGMGELTFAVHHELAHVYRHMPPRHIPAEEIEADYIAAQSCKCKTCILDTARSFWYSSHRRLDGATEFEQLSFDEIQKKSDEELKKYVDALNSIEIPANFSHPANLDRCFRLCYLARAVSSLCDHHAQAGQKRTLPVEDDASPSPKKKLKVPKKEGN